MPVGECVLLATLETSPYDHIEIFRQKNIDHFRSLIHVIGQIPVHHYVDVRLDVGEHSSNYIPFPLRVSPPNDRQRSGRHFSSSVSRVVIIYINLTTWHMFAT